MNFIFNEAKIKFNNSSEDKYDELILMYYGWAVFKGQELEEVFSYMLWTKRLFTKKAKTNDDVKRIIDRIDSSSATLGTLINEVKQLYKISEADSEKLEEVLNKRNYLVHEYFRERGGLLRFKRRKLEAIKYFCDFIAEADSTHSKMQDYFKLYSEKLEHLETTEEEINLHFLMKHLGTDKKTL